MEGEKSGTAKPSTCLINGGRTGDGIELEGSVASVGSGTFMLNVQGNRASGPVKIIASAATYRCNGPQSTGDCRANLKTGAQVHVRGTLGARDMTQAEVTAVEVKIQK